MTSAFDVIISPLERPLRAQKGPALPHHPPVDQSRLESRDLLTQRRSDVTCQGRPDERCCSASPDGSRRRRRRTSWRPLPGTPSQTPSIEGCTPTSATTIRSGASWTYSPRAPLKRAPSKKLGPYIRVHEPHCLRYRLERLSAILHTRMRGFYPQALDRLGGRHSCSRHKGSTKLPYTRVGRFG